MVVRPPTDSPDSQINSEAMSKQSRTNGRISPVKQKQTNGGSHTRKMTSLSPAKPIPRSKSMNGLNRVDSNKIKANGVADGRFKKDMSPQQTAHRSGDHLGKVTRGGNE